MTRVAPSQVVTAIGQLFPHVHSGVDFKLFQGNRPAVLALLDLIEHIPPELMPLDTHDVVQLIISLNFLRGALSQWATLCFRQARVNLDFPSPTVILIAGILRLGGDHETQHPITCRPPTRSIGRSV